MGALTSGLQIQPSEVIVEKGFQSHTPILKLGLTKIE